MIAKQVTFDIVARGLLDQGARAVAPNGRCVFRGPDGNRCALGFLIEDHQYDTFFDVNTQKGFDFIAALGHNEGLMHSLLEIHDQNPADTWAYLLGKLAMQHRLSVGVIDMWADKKSMRRPTFDVKVQYPALQNKHSMMEQFFKTEQDKLIYGESFIKAMWDVPLPIMKPKIPDFHAIAV